MTSDVPTSTHPGSGEATDSSAPLARGVRLRRLRLIGITKPYDVNFLNEADASHRSLGVIAGRTNTGKTAVLRFVDYAMGGVKLSGTLGGAAASACCPP